MSLTIIKRFQDVRYHNMIIILNPVDVLTYQWIIESRKGRVRTPERIEDVNADLS